MSEELQKVPITPVITEAIQDSCAITSSFKRMGLVRISAQSVRDLKRLGLHLGGVGVLPTTRGGMFINQQRMDMVMAHLVKLVMSPPESHVGTPIGGANVAGMGDDEEIIKTLDPAERAAMLSKIVALLGGKITESQRLMLESAGFRKGNLGMIEPPKPPKNKSFAPGVLVQINNAPPNTEVKVVEQKTVAPPAV